jgi:hypothetical protein
VVHPDPNDMHFPVLGPRPGKGVWQPLSEPDLKDMDSRITSKQVPRIEADLYLIMILDFA